MERFEISLETASETFSSLYEELDETIEEAKKVLAKYDINFVDFDGITADVETYLPDADELMSYFEYYDNCIVFYDSDVIGHPMDTMSLTDKLVSLGIIKVCLEELIN